MVKIWGVLLLGCSTTLLASEPASGTFVPSQGCDAYLSLRKGTNPGLVRVTPGSEYDIREVNGKEQKWIRVELPGVAEPLRWVATECGVIKDLQVKSASSGASPDSIGQCSTAGKQDSYVLAVSWQPGFCEHVKYDGKKPECDHLADGSLVVSNLTLHGLWPNLKACGKKYGSCANTPVDLTEDTISYISPWMPNFFYEKTFGNYEWQKHGTCSMMDDDIYFRRAADAVKTLNNSTAGKYITDNVGKPISKKEFYDRLTAETGRPQAINSITLMCTNKQLFEIRVSLPLDFKEGGSLDQLLGQSLPPTRDPEPKECKGDEILVEASGI